ncbi:neuropeptide Y receptor Y8b [Osmerus eperlanus]|uniref:neuropeptide Y receptor Y8b n=1 Tax=Osmerus eperlanus TaxID=29151 RepID=UPI002E1499AD
MELTNHNLSLIEEAPWEDKCPTSVGGTTFLIITYSTMMAVGIIGNASLVFVITRQKEMRNVTNIFIANLSCSDILMCIVNLPTTIVYTLMDRWILGEALCKITNFVQCLSITVSISSLVLIALERHQLIIHPTGWKPVVGHSYLAVAVTWILASLISVPFLSYTILHTPFNNLSIPFNPFTDYHICMEEWPSQHNRLAYTTSLLLFQYCLPVLLIVVCYLRIFLRLRRRRDMVERARDPSQRKIKGSKRINAVLGSIVFVFTLCWLPLVVFNAVFDWKHEAIPVCQHNVLFSACHLTAMASTCVNPVIYGFLNSNFQKELKSTLYHCRCWRLTERYETFPLSIVSTEVTKGSLLRKGSISINT